MSRSQTGYFSRTCKCSIIFLAAISLLPAPRAIAGTLTAIAKNGIRDSAPTDGHGDLIVGSPFIGWSSAGQTRAVAEFDLSTLFDRKLVWASVSGHVAPNNSQNTGGRVYTPALFLDNGTIELSDYEAPATDLYIGGHQSGQSSDFWDEVTTYVQNQIDNHQRYLGLRITPYVNPYGQDILSSSPQPAIDYELFPMGGNTARFFPKVDFNVSAEGGPYTLLEGEGGLNVQKIDYLGIDRRAVLEWDVSSIPASATITGVKMRLSLSGYGGGYHSPIYGYVGDGIASLADGFETTTQIGYLPDIKNFDPLLIDLDPHAVQSLLGTSHFFGTTFVGNPTGGSVGFYTTEFTNFPVFDAPQLFIQYEVPEPSTLALLLAALASAVRARRR